MTIPYNIVVDEIHALWILFTPTVSSGSSERSFLFYKPLTPINIIRPAKEKKRQTTEVACLNANRIRWGDIPTSPNPFGGDGCPFRPLFLFST